jgi:beta propeller repeat protein
MQKRLLRGLILSALIIGLMPIVASAVVSQEPFQHFPIAVAPDGQNQPAISWPWAVYKDTNDCAPVIRAYNFETGETRLAQGSLTTFDVAEHANPDIDGTKVVYSSDIATDCDVYMYDLATGVESVVAQAVNGQGNPSIDYPYVAWTDWRHGGNGDIYMKNLSTGMESVVTTAGADEREPTVWDHYVCYRGSGDVYLYDINFGTTSNITSDVPNLSSAYDPFLADGIVAWYGWDSDLSEYVIQMYDIAEDECRTVASSPSPWHPEVGGGWITWPDSRTGYREVYGYHIQSRVVKRLVASTIDSEGETTQGGRSTVAATGTDGKAVTVWHDHRNESLPGSTTLNPDGTGSADLYAQYLVDMFGPVITITGVDDGVTYTEPVKPVVTCEEGCAVTAKVNGVQVSSVGTLTAEGVYTIVATARDSLSNPGRAEVTFAIDNNEPPAGTMALCGGTNYVRSRDLTIDSAMTDGQDMEMRYSLDGGDFTAWVDYDEQVDVDVMDEGFHDVLVEYEDESGNTSSRWDWVYVDSDAPVGTFVVNAGAERTATRTVRADSSVAGAAMMRFYAAGSWTCWVPYAATYNLTLPSSAGVRTVYAQYADAAWNILRVSDTIRYTPPATLGTPVCYASAVHGVPFDVIGTISPKHAVGGKVRIYKYRYYGGKWINYGYVNTYVTSTGYRYSGKLSLPVAGKWMLRAYHYDYDNSPSWSAGYKIVTVK